MVNILISLNTYFSFFFKYIVTNETKLQFVNNLACVQLPAYFEL